MPPDPTYLTGGSLGTAHAPLLIGTDHDDNPANPDFRVRAFDTRRRARRSTASATGCELLEQLEAASASRPRRLARRASASGPSTCCPARRPARRSTSTASRPRVRDRYGRHPLGQNLLLARRLIEAGVRLVSVVALVRPGAGRQVPERRDLGHARQRRHRHLRRRAGTASAGRCPAATRRSRPCWKTCDVRGLLDEHAGGAGRRVRPHAADQPGRLGHRPRPLAATATRRCSPAAGIRGGAVYGALRQAGGLREGPPGLARGLRGDAAARAGHRPRTRRSAPTASPSGPARAGRSSTCFSPPI